ncbi:hypothetical protein D6774_04465 [Candidatus Woesearchaeota archaeon]|nr:MAG: hypothetical protein D6774_04465 [Candidatus Woesearchaeota archaeon]
MNALDLTTVKKSLEKREEVQEQLQPKIRSDERQLKWINKWIENLEHDKNVYAVTLDYVVPNLPGFESFFGKKFKNKFLPTRDEYNLVVQVEQDLNSGQYTTPNIEEFIREIEKSIDRLASKSPDPELIRRMANSKKVLHAKKYLEELRYLQEQLNKLQDDDEKWTYFRNEFYKNRDGIARIIEKRFGDERFAFFLMDFFHKHHEDREGIKRVYQEVIRHMQSPQGILEVEKEALAELHEIVANYLKALRENLEELRTWMIKELKRKKRDYELRIENAGRPLYHFFKKQDKLIQDSAALRAEQKQVVEQIKRSQEEVTRLRRNREFMRNKAQRTDDFEEKKKLWEQILATDKLIKAKLEHAADLVARLGITEEALRKMLRELEKESEQVISKAEKFERSLKTTSQEENPA